MNKLQTSTLKFSLFSLLTITLTLANPVVNAASYQQVYDGVFNQAWVAAATNEAERQHVTAEQAVYNAKQLPQYAVNYNSVFAQGDAPLKQRATATLTDTVDHYPRLVKQVHANGICMAGVWYITQPVSTAYTGMFANGASSLFIGRLSTALSETQQGQPRAFGLAGKLFGTMNPNQEVTTANFFVADVLSGTQRDSVFDAPMTNHPKFYPRFGILRLGLKLAGVFAKADEQAAMRPVVNLAQMGNPSGNASNGNKSNNAVVAPTGIMLLSLKPKQHTVVNGSDFRKEFALTDTAVANKQLRHFAIYVSQTAKQPEDNGWEHIGYITVKQTTVSYACDRQLHFAHPKVAK